jgi:hypothetical protein
MQSGSNYLSVCIFPQVIENIPLVSLPASPKWVKLLCTREIYALAAERSTEILTSKPLRRHARPALGDAQRWW